MSEEAKTEAKESRNLRKTRKGVVVKKSGDKTISVLVERRYRHPIYGKQVTISKKYHTHDEKNEAAVGDIVVISETRPISATKRWRLTKVLVSKLEVEAAAEAKAEQVIAAEEGK